MSLRALLACLPLVCAIAPAAAAPASDPLAAGRKAFQRCAGCHQVGPGARSEFGPQLNGILGRRAGSAPGYAYSPALARAGFIWTEQRLAAFLRDPDAVVPGNKMRFWGLSSRRQIADLLVFLRAQPARQGD